MEDTGAFNVIKKFKWVILIIVLMFVALLVFKICNVIMIRQNTDALTEYLEQEEFSKNVDGTYIKTISNDNEEIMYIYSSSQAIIKTITSDDGNLVISMNFQNDNVINSTLYLHDKNKNGKYGNLLLKSSYDVKTEKFDCKILKNDNFDIMCDKLKKETINYKDEIVKLSKAGNFNIKYIK